MSRRRKHRNDLRSNPIPTALLPLPGTEVGATEPVFAGRRPGHITLCPEPVLQRYLTALRAGNIRRDAALYAGLSPDVVHKWITRGRGQVKGRPATPEYVRFVRLVEEAEATASIIVVGGLMQRARVDTRAAIYWLRARHPEDWPAEQAAGVGNPDAGVVIDQRQQAVVFLNPDEHPELVASILAQKRADRAEGPKVIAAPEPEVSRAGVRHAALDSLRQETDPRRA